jgi:hypothetical protein
MSNAIDLAHRDAVEGVVISDLRQDRYGWTPILWALFRVRGGMRYSTLVQIQHVMRRTQTRWSEGLAPLVNFLVSAQHLRQLEDVVSFAHPSVRNAFERHMQIDPARAVGAVEALVEALTNLKGDLASWGAETAALMARLATSQFHEDFMCPERAQSIIDSWLTEGLIDPTSRFEDLLSLTADVSSAGLPVGNLARWLVKGFQTGGHIFDDNWKRPDFPQSMFAAIGHDHQCHLVCDRFVRTILPNSNDRYGADFAAEVAPFGGDLDDAFLDAAMQVAKGSHYSNAETIARAASKDLLKYEPILEQALRHLRPDEQQEAKDAEIWLQIQNHELDEGAEDWFIDRGQEDFGSEQIVATYVERLREKGHWEGLARHPEHRALFAFWEGDVRADKGQVSLAELEALIELGKLAGREEDAWRAAQAHWQDDLGVLLLARLAAGSWIMGLMQPLPPV